MSANTESNIGSIGSGTFMGEVPVLRGIPYEVTARTLEQSHLFKIKKEVFWQMISTCSLITQGILRTMAQRVQGAINFITTTSKARFAWELVSRTCS